MVPKKVQNKFSRWGRKAEFARQYGYSNQSITLYLRGGFKSARLDKLMREWKPNGKKAQSTSPEIASSDVL